ncbi:P-loop containing nucleoside triphosphate hydrolase protein [Serendipita vermifera]|nr:P-loop containing nucleoside triphosphate hydrolase protein [Serendipita vermifera]
MPPSRPERYNAKARRSVAGGSSHKKKKLKKALISGQLPDSNAEILERKSLEEKEASRRQVLMEELLLENQGASSKKKRRLEKYIDKKLRKEERVVLLQKLAKTQTQVSTVQLQSSSTLGTGNPYTAAERDAREEHTTVKKAIAAKQRRNGPTSGFEMHESDEDVEDSDSEMSDVVKHESLGSGPHQPIPILEIDPLPLVPQNSNNATTVVAGSALKRNADGTINTPVMKPRKQKNNSTKFSAWKNTGKATKNEEDQMSESSFDSSDSANDTSSEGGDQGDGSDTVEDATGQSPSNPSESPPKPKFKDWAMEQMRGKPLVPTEEYQTYTNIEAMKEAQASLPESVKKRQINDDAPRGPMGARLNIPSTAFAQVAQKERTSKQGASGRNVPKINRTNEIRASRIMLPILAEEQRITESVLLHPVVIICGETGSGKTTQVPQFLYEAGFASPGSDNPGMIGITQPRRVAAVSMAMRVSEELALPSSIVSYQIRYDATTAPTTAIKFMTDGVLLREMATDFLLSRYSVIIVDEAHERSLNTDILIGTLSRVIKLREEMWLSRKAGAKPLRLIIMSATLRVADFAENATLFPTPPPIIKIDARQHPVTIHFDRRTRHDYVTQAIRKAIKIHTRLPAGGILIFLTGQQEIAGVCKRLESKYGLKAINQRKEKMKVQNQPMKLPNLFPEVDEDRQEKGQANGLNVAIGDIEPEDIELGESKEQLAADVDDNVAEVDEEALDTESENDEKEDQLLVNEGIEVPMHVIPLYSLLSSKRQMKVFESPPEGSRLVVVATNVAETSLTIPGIRYVVDCGRAKERQYDISSGIQSFRVTWTSKASAAQRAGRAGRTGPGHCYRLYSSSLYEHYFEQYASPEILRTPIEGTVLQMKSMHIDTIVNFPFPTPPDRLALKKAEKLLSYLGAIESNPRTTGHITSLGRTMAMFPVHPRFGKMLVNGVQHGCLPYVISIVAGLSVGDPFLREDQLKEDDDSQGESTDEEDAMHVSHLRDDELREREKRKVLRKTFFESQALHTSLGNGQSDLFRLLSVIGAYEFAGGTTQFCRKHFVRDKAMEEIHKLRAQISSIVSSILSSEDTGFAPRQAPPSPLQLKVLRQLITAGFIDQIAGRKDVVEKGSSTGTKMASARGVEYRAIGIEEDVFIHPSSVLFHQTPPEYVAFHEVVRGTKVWIKTLTVINPAWLAHLGPALCTFSKPLPIPPTIKDMKPGEVLVVPRFGPGWELPPMRKMK